MARRLWSRRFVMPPAGASRIADLFAGLGTFALSLDGQVTSAEASRDAVLALKSAAARAGRALSVEHRDLYRRPYDAKELAAFDAVVLDPPRAGAQEQVKRASCLVASQRSPMSAATRQPSPATQRSWPRAATRSIGRGPSASFAGRPMSSSQPPLPDRGYQPRQSCNIRAPACTVSPSRQNDASPNSGKRKRTMFDVHWIKLWSIRSPT